MSKKKVQRNILKISTNRLKAAKWNMKITLDEAARNEELVAIGNNKVLRWIDEMLGIEDRDGEIVSTLREVKCINREPDSTVNKRTLSRLCKKLKELKYVPHYVSVIVNSKPDYRRICKNGFVINGIKYARLLGTSGGVKQSTIIFVNEEMVDELRSRIDNGRNLERKFVPAKLEAYRALTCSDSHEVSSPNGVLVVHDCETTFYEDVVKLSFEDTDEPVMTNESNYRIDLNASDGCGMMSPQLAERWSKELGYHYICGAFNTRCAWEKGVVFAFDFHEFAKDVAGKSIVIDAWGNEIDINNVELVLTTSMLKLWDSYSSIDDYLQNCQKNGYNFSVTKHAPATLEHYRGTNYQFLQSFELSDEDIKELVDPTINKFKDILGGDVNKAKLFLCGTNMDKYTFNSVEPYIQALLLDERMIEDPMVFGTINRNLTKKIKDAKIGVLDLHANYSILGGDLYALCESMFGMPVKGLLKAGELYNKYWLDESDGDVLCFRAPMSTHANIRRLSVNRDEKVQYWFRFVNTCTFLNCWDSTTAALNGCDYDGDIMYITDNEVLLRNHKVMPTIVCTQRNAEKCIPTEEDFIESNIRGFGDDIGKITNRITSMFSIQSNYDKNSEEYKTLEYRIQAGQLLQQDSIDRIKGIVSNPMPLWWYERRGVMSRFEGYDEALEFHLSLAAHRKPYFMKYIYPKLNKESMAFRKSSQFRAKAIMKIDIDDLLALPDEQLTDDQREFLKSYDYANPTDDSPCTMNRICWYVENEMKKYPKTIKEKSNFDFSQILGKVTYSKRKQYLTIKYYKEFVSIVKLINLGRGAADNLNKEGMANLIQSVKDVFWQNIRGVSSNYEETTSLMIDVCYGTASGRCLTWMMVGDYISEKMQEMYQKYTIVVKDDEGDIEYLGNRYSVLEMETNNE